MKVTFKPFIIAAISTVTEGLIKGLGELEIKWLVENLNSCIIEIGNYWEEFWRLEQICSHSDSSERLSALVIVKNSQIIIILIIIIIFANFPLFFFFGLEDLEVGGRVETIQTTALLKTARILGRVLATWGDLLSLNLQWKTISLRWCDKL